MSSMVNALSATAASASVAACMWAFLLWRTNVGAAAVEAAGVSTLMPMRQQQRHVCMHHTPLAAAPVR
jgi:hypothetical protein